MPDDPKAPDESKSRAWGVAFSAGSELVVYALGGFFLGQWLDRKFANNEPYCGLAGAVMGIFAGLYRLVGLFEAPGRPLRGPPRAWSSRPPPEPGPPRCGGGPGKRRESGPGSVRRGPRRA